MTNRYINEIGKYPLLTVAEEEDLVKLVKSGDLTAREKLINSNLRFVLSVAKSYANSKNLPDLINEGNIGLIETVELFDPTSGFKFITYAIWHIRKRILSYLSTKNKLIRVPENKVRFVRNSNQVEQRLSQELGRTPSTEEIIDAYLDDDSIQRKEKASTTGLVKAIGMINGTTDLFSSPFENYELIDTIDGSLNQPDSKVIAESDNVLLMSYINTLSKKDRDIIKMRHGFDGNEEMTFLQIGEYYDQTLEAIRIRYKASIRRLRHRMTRQIKGKYNPDKISQFF
jgi:RNA polymerase primary sigma factor